MILLNTGILAVVAPVVWWLTGRDKSWDGQSKQGRHFTRALRTVAVSFLFFIMLWTAEGGGGAAAVPLLLIFPILIALALRSSVSEIFAGGFLRLVDPALHDRREMDLKCAQRHRDNIAWLIHHDKREEAVRLCEELKKSGELDAATLANTLEFLGVPQDFGKISEPLHEARRLRALARFSEAETYLRTRLVTHPADSGAALLLMRVCAEDLRRPDAAANVLAALEKQPRVSPDHLEFARRSLAEWRRPKPGISPVEVLPHTLDEMLKQKCYGSAIGFLEEKIKAQPRELDWRLKLAEVHAVHCDNWPRAEKIVRQLAVEKIFGADQLAFAESKLKGWRESQLPLK